MALLVTKDNQRIFISAEQANLLWLVKTGERKATAKTKAKVNKIVKWYLNRNTAPDSWKQEYPTAAEIKQRQLVTQLRLPYKG